jgi:WD40 repeat protein
MINSSHISRNLVNISSLNGLLNFKHLKRFKLEISDVYWSNDGKILIQSGEDKETRLWDPTTLKVIHSFPKKQYIQSSCHISSNNFYAITSSNGFQRNGCEITVSLF